MERLRGRATSDSKSRHLVVLANATCCRVNSTGYSDIREGEAIHRLVAIGLLFLPCASGGHHSHGEFSEALQELDGELIDVVWRNPHPAMTLRVSDSDVGDIIWRVQVVGNVNGLRRNGVTGDLLRVGERLRVQGRPSSRRSRLLLASLATLDDGTEIVLGPDESTGQALYGIRNASNSSDSAEVDTSLFRVWMVSHRVRNPDLPLTEASAAAKAAWDPLLDDPQRGCQALGMPGAMMSPHPIEIIDQGDSILIHLEEWNAMRTVYLQPDVSSDELEATPLGYSTGVWDGDTLVVTTTHIDYPYLDEHGTPQSEAVRVIERFVPSSDNRALDWTAEISDPGTMTEPVIAFTTRWEWVPGETIQDYDCQELDPLSP